MIRGLYTACAGMMVQMTRQDVLSNNLANVNTTGFKKDLAIAQEFPSMLLQRFGEKTEPPRPIKAPVVGELGTGAAIALIATDYSCGSYRATENSLDLALGPDTYFTIETEQGIRYSRNGAFDLNPEGMLVNVNGQPVLGTDGYIYLEGPFAVDERGNIIQDGETVATLAIASFPDQSGLMKMGDDLYAAENVEAEVAENPQVFQGYLESSNVNAVKEMVDLITAVRAYEVMQKVIQAEDQTLDKVINQAGAM